MIWNLLQLEAIRLRPEHYTHLTPSGFGDIFFSMMLYMEGQPFSQELLRRIQDRVDLEPELSRRALSRKVCEWLDWRSVTGKWQEMSCRKALAKLNRQGLLRLPEVSQQYSFQRRTEKESV